jgi:predicted ATPase
MSESSLASSSMPPPTHIQRLALRNYKSFAHCDVALAPLAFIVGANGSGKSNFLDALRFVSDALRTSLDHAMRDRGGIGEVRRRSGGHPNHFGIRLDLTLPSGQRGFYAFQIAALSEGRYEVQREECSLSALEPSGPLSLFCVEKGIPRWSLAATPPAASTDRLYLVNASGLPEFRLLYDALSHMGFYNLSPDRIRDLQAPDVGDLLARDGANLASVLAELAQRSPAGKQRVEEYLAKVVDGVQAVDVRQIGTRETLEFRQSVSGSKSPWRFLANSMSDGTLRALGILVALFRAAMAPGRGSPSWASRSRRWRFIREPPSCCAEPCRRPAG